MNTQSAARPDRREARGGVLDYEHVQGLVRDLRRGDRTPLWRTLAVLLLGLVVVVAAGFAGLYALDRATGWDEVAGSGRRCGLGARVPAG